MSDFEPAGRFFDKQIEDVSGTVVGHVEDMLVDVGSGQIEYVLIALPGNDGHRAETITIPWSLVIPDTRRHRRWRVCVRKTVLERLAPTRVRR